VQQGSVILTGRKHGPDVWQFRWSEKDRSGRRIYHKRVIGTVQQYPDAQAAREVTTALVGISMQVQAGARSLLSRSVSILNRENCDPAIRSGASLRRRLIAATFASGLSRAGVLATWTKSKLWTSKHGCEGSPWLDPHAQRFEASCRSCLIMRAGTNSLTAIRCGLSARAQNAGALRMC
jgi:hypothetical protein